MSWGGWNKNSCRSGVRGAEDIRKLDWKMPAGGGATVNQRVKAAIIKFLSVAVGRKRRSRNRSAWRQTVIPSHTIDVAVRSLLCNSHMLTMDESLVQTATHTVYPMKEVLAMYDFHGGPPLTCAATGSCGADIHFSHQMPLSSNKEQRLNVMLARKLRVPRNEAHAGELRENVIPCRLRTSYVLVSIQLHDQINALIPTSALFPCEEDLIRAVAYEREVKALRLEWVRNGRGDPGRPDYVVGYPLVDVDDASGPVLPHRLHSSGETGEFAVVRYSRQGNITTYQTYDVATMPGEPGAADRYPVIRTLLSIPFSVLHNTPRLQSLFPRTPYQRVLLALANELISLWSWDPAPGDFPGGIAVEAVGVPSWPPPIYDQSRAGTTYLPPPSFIVPPPTLANVERDGADRLCVLGGWNKNSCRSGITFEVLKILLEDAGRWRCQQALRISHDHSPHLNDVNDRNMKVPPHEFILFRLVPSSSLVLKFKYLPSPVPS
ncbi:hypothetical protein C8J57DRAFT_1485394 [Mycena rebaudengoi]|nr:hypothetical protein C8J57DRAFT_1485394 [Mycena rebaudengoi]